MNEKSIRIIKTKITHVAENNALKKVLFIDDKNMQQVHNICRSGINTDL